MSQPTERATGNMWDKHFANLNAGKAEALATERALQLARREGWIIAKMDRAHPPTYDKVSERIDLLEWQQEAARVFPLPKTVVPREETFGEYAYRVVDGQLQYASRFREGWSDGCYPSINTAVDAKRLLDLFERPTEEREGGE